MLLTLWYNRSMNTNYEQAWAAGLFEGEGWITMRNQDIPSAQMGLASTDKDTVERFHSAIGGLGGVFTRNYQNPNHKLQWVWQSGKFEHIQAIISLLWPGLNERRRTRAAEVLKEHVRLRQVIKTHG